jgi:hypothetical protein
MTTSPGTPMMMVYDVESDSMIEVTVADQVAGMIDFARSLGPGTPACAVWERRAIELATEHGLWPPKRRGQS